jgi:hypothetical protein
MKWETAPSPDPPRHSARCSPRALGTEAKDPRRPSHLPRLPCLPFLPLLQDDAGLPLFPQSHRRPRISNPPSPSSPPCSQAPRFATSPKAARRQETPLPRQRRATVSPASSTTPRFASISNASLVHGDPGPRDAEPRVAVAPPPPVRRAQQPRRRNDLERHRVRAAVLFRSHDAVLVFAKPETQHHRVGLPPRHAVDASSRSASSRPRRAPSRSCVSTSARHASLPSPRRHRLCSIGLVVLFSERLVAADDLAFLLRSPPCRLVKPKPFARLRGCRVNLRSPSSPRPCTEPLSTSTTWPCCTPPRHRPGPALGLRSGARSDHDVEPCPPLHQAANSTTSILFLCFGCLQLQERHAFVICQ